MIDKRYLGLFLLAAVACDKLPGSAASETPPPAPSKAGLRSFVDTWPEARLSPEAIARAWKSAGLETGALGFIDPEPLNAEACKAGMLRGFDVLVCSYGDTDSRGEAMSGAKEWASGAQTVIIENNGPTMLVVADRAGSDPPGQKVERAADIFRALQ